MTILNSTNISDGDIHTITVSGRASINNPDYILAEGGDGLIKDTIGKIDFRSQSGYVGDYEILIQGTAETGEYLEETLIEIAPSSEFQSVNSYGHVNRVELIGLTKSLLITLRSWEYWQDIGVINTNYNLSARCIFAVPTDWPPLKVINYTLTGGSVNPTTGSACIMTLIKFNHALDTSITPTIELDSVSFTDNVSVTRNANIIILPGEAVTWQSEASTLAYNVSGSITLARA